MSDERMYALDANEEEYKQPELHVLQCFTLEKDASLPDILPLPNLPSLPPLPPSLATTPTPQR